MKPFQLIIVLMLCAFISNAQTSIVKYYDADWIETAKEQAIYFAEFLKEASGYKCTTYWINSNKVRGISTYPDTVMKNPIGLQRLYYKNGNLEDSSFYDANGTLKSNYHYFDNKKLAAHFYLPENKKEPIIEGFDEAGNKLKDYVYAREAGFKGGASGWQAYLLKNISKDFYNVKDDSPLNL